ncbi:hypothetical protein DFR29_101419 [Tahibacter aquaticus]|uniref:Secreted protein n=1 Tax=Tahibacter aquaticus TaxID=520092 RepID=A0A4R6ZA85_9GAMM|nr:hypothetical protein [Tahibacter aquaticus]TDR48795.1 hypothetical protein DFR29_101419 [Tahibacter aquaticus]
MSVRAAVVFALCAAAAGSARAAEVPLFVEFSDGFELIVPTAFRLGALQLRDPHVFVRVPLGPTTLCTDATDLPSVGLNAQIATSLAADENADGRLDSSALLLFRPLLSDGRSAQTLSVAGDCSVATPTQCLAAANATPSLRSYRAFALSGSDHCLEALAGTTSNWGSAAAVPAPGGNCYATTAADLVLDTGSLQIPLYDTAFGAPLPAPGGSTGGGLMRGFLRASDAALIPIPLNGTTVTLASVLPGGAGSCRANVSGGIDTWRGESGWWFYFEYRQDAVGLN